MRLHRSPPWRSLFLGTIAATVLSCGGGGELIEPTTGAVEITTSTSGSEPDPDGYGVSLDGAELQSIGVAARIVLQDLTPGLHRVELTGIASNCTVDGENDREVSVIAGETASLSFSVVCTGAVPATGSVSVTVATSGASPDPDGYSITVDGDEGRPLAVNGSVTVPDLSVGDHVVGLAGVAANCSVDGENPRIVQIAGGVVSAVSFAVECEQPPAAVGSVTITTVTGGAGTDPDGYVFTIGSGAEQPIGADASVSVANVAAGATTVELAGLSADCDVSGQNPRPVTVPAGGSVEVAFEITCAGGTGTLVVTTSSSGSPADPSGYTISLDGASPVAIGNNASRTFGDLAPGQHSVALGGVAGNCAVQGTNPRAVTVAPGATATTDFTIQCSATTGGLTVTVAGLPAGVNAAITVTGPGNFSETVTATETLSGLEAGQYTVSAAGVSSGGVNYTSTPAERDVEVTAGATAEVTVTYIGTAPPTVNLRIPGVYLTQSVQTFRNEIPLVTGRDAFLRVFVRADRSNEATPDVRVRLFDDDRLVETFVIEAPGGSVPTTRDEGVLNSSWNVLVPGSLIQPGLSVQAEVDPDGAFPETNENDNRFPDTGEPAPVEVRTTPPLAIRLIPVRQSANQLQGDVTAGNRDQYLDLARRVYPLPRYTADLHELYITTTTDPLQSDDANGAWNTILSEILALQIAEGSPRHYYGVVRTGYTTGLVGRGFIGLPAAIGYDEPGDRARVTAHELGHTWGRNHSPCGNPEAQDPQFPYSDGNIGRFGFDVAAQVLKPVETPDVMGYCGDAWISDYTYRAVLDFRGIALGRLPADRAVPSVLVWGHIANGRAVVEPAFELVTHPVLPGRPGPYSIEATAGDGSRLFRISFDAAPVADDQRGARHFAFAIPLARAASARLERIRLTGPGVGMAAASRSPASLRAGPLPPPQAVATAGGVALRWDAAAYPMVMVRDAGTGEVLSFARGGTAQIPAAGAELELITSDGVGSRSTTFRR